VPAHLKIKIDNFVIAATDCDLLGRVAKTPTQRQAYHLKAEQLARLASDVRTDLVERELSDVEFLNGIAAQLREIAATCVQKGIKAELLAMAEDMEKRIRREEKH
jgi:hypothetical protein